MSAKDKKRALIVSISEYDNFEILPFCLNDGEEMYNLLKVKLAYEVPDNNKLLGNVDYDKMRNALVKFFTDPNNRPDDTLVFYFSGHGALDNDGNSYFACSETDPLLPYVSGIPFDLPSLLARDCKSNRIVMILDCCYSGKATLGKGKGETDEEEAVKLGKVAIENRIKEGYGTYLLASSQGYQKSYPMPDKSYSLFTNLVIQGLEGHVLSVDSDGYVTPESLDKFIHYMISQLPETVQKPIRKVLASGDIRLAYHPNLAKPQQQTSQKAYLFQQLREGKIEAFNRYSNLEGYREKGRYRLTAVGEDLSRLKLDNVDFHNVDLSEASLHYSSLIKANLKGAYIIGMKAEGADLSYSDLREAEAVRAGLSRSRLVSAKMSKANFSEAELFESDLSTAHAVFSRFNKSHLVETKLHFTNLYRADLSEADLRKSNFYRANLLETILMNANLEATALVDVNLMGANLTGADLSNSVILCYLYQHVSCGGAECRDAIILDEGFRDYLQNHGALNVPRAVAHKDEVSLRLRQMGYDDQVIEPLIEGYY